MYDLTYISDADRQRLIFLNEKLRMCETIEEQQEVREEIATIESKRKPLNECDMNECTELRTAIWNKFDKLNRTGRYSVAQQFKGMMRQIEIRQGLILRQLAEDEAKRKQIEAEAKARKLAEASADRDNSETEGDDQTQAQSVSSRWTTGIGSLD